MQVPNRSGYQAYQRNKFETASPHRLILMLYEGAMKFGNQAIKSLDTQDVETSNKALTKTQDILYELIACLNDERGGQIAGNLRQLYLYMIDLLVQANLQKDKAKVVEAMGYLQDIKSAWEQIGKEVAVGPV